VTLYRRLTEAAPATHEPGLARSLWVYAGVRVIGHLELSGAFTSIKEACAVHRRWHESLPPEFSGDPAGALGSAVDVLDALGRSGQSTALRHLIEAQKLGEAADLLQETAPP
jgi:hypothetical protein